MSRGQSLQCLPQALAALVLEQLEELQQLAKERYLSPAFIAAIHAGLGQQDEAFSWLEEAFRLRSRYLVWLKVAPEYEQLRSDPRYQDLIGRIGLS